MARTAQAGFPAPRKAAPEVRTWRGFAPELADVLCIECRGGALPMQARDEFALVLCRSTARLTDPQGHCSLVGPDEVGVARPGEMYRMEAAADGATLCVLLVAPAVLGVDPGPARTTEPLRFRVPVVRDAALAERLHTLFGELRRGLTTLDALTRFRAAAADLAARHLGCEPAAGAARRVHPGAARLHRYLSERFAEPVSLEDLMRASGLSRFYLLRVFRREYGVTPHEYQRHLRLARACRLLSAGVPASRVAYEVGFSDQSHLIRQFRTLTGVTPGAFARQWTSAGQERTRAAPPPRPGSAAPARA